MRTRALAAILVALVSASAGIPASARTGLLSKTEICFPDGSYRTIDRVVALAGTGDAIAIDRNGDQDLWSIRNGGQLRGRLDQVGIPTLDGRLDGIVELDRGAPGNIYAIDGSTSRVFQLSVSPRSVTLVRELHRTYGIAFQAPIGTLASRTTNEVLVLNVRQELSIFDQSTGEPTREALLLEPTGTQASASIDIAAVRGALIVGKTFYGARDQDKIVYFHSSDVPGAKRFSYIAAVPTPPSMQAIAANDDTIWLIAGNDLYRYSRFGEQLERIPDIDGDHLDVAADGSVWVARSDGVLHLGQGGTKIPRSTFRSASHDCGPPGLRISFAREQSIFEKSEATLSARCDEPCRVKLTGRLRVPGHTPFTLTPDSRRIGADQRGKLKLRFSNKALRAMKEGFEQGQPALLDVTATARDGSGMTRTKDRTLVLSL